MKCPYCQQPLSATAAECPACRLSFARTCALLGAMPMLQAGVGDTTRSLSLREYHLLKDRIEAFQQRFPQVVIQVAIHSFPQAHPFSLYAFWIFNAGIFSGQANRGIDNHTLLLLLDPDRGESALMPGYGLEPFLEPAALDALLDLATSAWAVGRWAEGILLVLDALEKLLQSLASPFTEEPLPAGTY